MLLVLHSLFSRRGIEWRRRKPWRHAVVRKEVLLGVLLGELLKVLLGDGSSRVILFRAQPSPRLSRDAVPSSDGVRPPFSFAPFPGQTSTATALCCASLPLLAGRLCCLRCRGGITADVLLRELWNGLGGNIAPKRICSSWEDRRPRRSWVFR